MLWGFKRTLVSEYKRYNVMWVRGSGQRRYSVAIHSTGRSFVTTMVGLLGCVVYLLGWSCSIGFNTKSNAIIGPRFMLFLFVFFFFFFFCALIKIREHLELLLIFSTWNFWYNKDRISNRLYNPITQKLSGLGLVLFGDSIFRHAEVNSLQIRALWFYFAP